ncbi:MAG: hypothetical protein ACREJ0_17475, partial [Geminicoccaceae bacterium]
MQNAPGWRVAARPQRSSWRAGYVIVPVSVMVALLQIFFASDDDRMGDRRQQVSASEAPSSTVDPAARTPDAKRQPGGEGIRQGAEQQERRPLLRRSRLARADGAGAADRAAIVGPTPIRIFIHHAAGARNALTAMQLAASLQTQGFV